MVHTVNLVRFSINMETSLLAYLWDCLHYIIQLEQSTLNVRSHSRDKDLGLNPKEKLSWTQTSMNLTSWLQLQSNQLPETPIMRPYSHVLYL